jgi:hypothetical protein
MRDWLWAVGWVFTYFALTMGVTAAMTRFWVWPLIQADSPWQYLAFTCTVIAGLLCMFGTATAFVRSVNR